MKHILSEDPAGLASSKATNLTGDTTVPCKIAIGTSSGDSMAHNREDPW